MSKYKVGDKFIVEVKEVLNDELPYDTENLYRIDGFKTLVFDDYGLDKLQKYDKYAENLERNHEVLKIFEEKYNNGLNDAWKLVRKIYAMEAKEFDDVFGYIYPSDAFNFDTPQEALAKIEAYEKSQQIQVGDVVYANDGTKSVVIDDSQDEGYMWVFNENGCVEEIKIKHLKKTGRHIDIEHLLEQIRGDE